MACKHVCCNKTDEAKESGLVIRITGTDAQMATFWAIEDTLVILHDDDSFEADVSATLDGKSVYSNSFELPRHDVLVKNVKAYSKEDAAQEVYEALEGSGTIDFESTEIVW